jgi:hypothetical protein
MQEEDDAAGGSTAALEPGEKLKMVLCVNGAKNMTPALAGG